MKRKRWTQHEQALARRRAELIVQVQNGLLSAQAAARQLAISRQTYYKWERRALQAMVTALRNRRNGPPARPRDPEKTALQRQNRRLQKQIQVLRQLRRLRLLVNPPNKKKNERAMMIVRTLTTLTAQTHWPYLWLCQCAALPYSTVMRWKSRLAGGAPAIAKPGPKKIAPLPREQLQFQVRQLRHGRQRSRGVGALYRQYQGQISRRDLHVLVFGARREFHRQQEAQLRRVTWHVPGLVWSLDDAELLARADGRLHLHQVQDLASRYKFTPLVGECVAGTIVAERLERLFWQHGPPLVLKRDNGPNLNHAAVDAVLAHYLVVPLNSPPYYPPYNGGMECGIRELKTPLVEKMRASTAITAPQVQSWAEMLAHDLNHRHRDCLHGQVACNVFQAAKPNLKVYTRRRRTQIVNWINELTTTLMERLALHTQRQAATVRRLAIERWLETNGVITITHNKTKLCQQVSSGPIAHH